MKVAKLLPSLVIGLLLATRVSQGCPTCKDSFTKSDDGNGTKLVSKGLNSVGLGFGWSVLFMLAAPASVAGGLIWLVVKNGRGTAGSSVS